MDEIAAIVAAAPERIWAAESLEDVDQLTQELVGRSSALNTAQRRLGSLPEDERPRVGAFLNEARKELTALLDERRSALERASEDRLLTDESVDVTLPGRVQPYGTGHLITETMNELTDIFVSLGYDVADGPEAELAYYNFDALNIPPGHPARADMDTIYLAYGDPRDEVLLRAHTSPVQVRYMEEHDPPVFIVVPGRVYRLDNDATHSPVFHQLEGLAVDDNITFADLRGTLAHFVREFLGPGREVRFRPGYFPFTEPSAEMDVSWDDGWLELLGCGVVDPAVLEAVGYDPSRVSGFAFGMGIERLAMARHGISHVKHLYSGDVRVLEQFV